MRNLGFGAQGQQQSDQCSIPLGTICRAPVRLSVFALGLFGYQLLQILRTGGSSLMPLWWMLLQQCGYFFVLYLTVLCHEFGHGNMARYLGGEIDHILLWVFGGICFSTRARTDDNRKLVRDDLLIVAAGPSTHFAQAPAWGLLLCLVWLISPQLATDVYKSPWDAFMDALLPWGNALSGVWIPLLISKAYGSAFLWSLAGTAVQLNVMLFLFNVFFPMYPADGSKLLVSSLMFCCGVPARTAAKVLLCVSVPCGLLLVAWSLKTFIVGVSAGQGGAAMLNSIMGFMGVMSLVESYKIYELRRTRMLHTHPLFQTARSWNRSERDAFGRVNRINVSDFDDEAPLTTGGACKDLFFLCMPSEGRCWLCPCFWQPRDREVEAPVQPVRPVTPEVRTQRNQGLLNQIDRQAAERQRTVRDMVESRHPLSSPGEQRPASCG